MEFWSPRGNIVLEAHAAATVRTILDMEDDIKSEALVEHAFAYILSGLYPNECTENKKRAIRRKAGNLFIVMESFCTSIK